ncbi:acyltransferase [Myroides sp. JBRI-B21084]|uniref:acyltransferase n=1 Tax=Myroides sp. JBRI-B21084 TaxID=3119977 RepID=UPI0026E18CE3|nr:acyltransferase [Paenimyroides cloacae]WKW45557.1 acyltransferase [Paenimyroides cloacae]
MRTSLLYLYNFLNIFLPDTKFFKFKVFMLKLAGATVGKNVRICSSTKILGNGKLTIGNNTWIGHECMIICSSSITIGNNVDIAPRVYIGTGTHIIDVNSKNIAGEGISKDVIICNGCWIGVNSTILPGVMLEEKAIVAAGSVVTKDVLTFYLVGGVPAKPIKKIT